MRKYDHLFFDLDNTLWDFTANSRLAMEQTLTENGLLQQLPSFNPFFKVYEQINHALWSDYHARKISKQELIVRRFSKSLQEFGVQEFDWQKLNRRYLENMALQTQLFPSTKETLATLKDRGYKMYIITNGFREVQYDKLANCGLDGYFSKVFISEEIHTAKPHREIFEFSLKSANAPKKKSVMIGDSWETDIEGALQFGIDQIMFTNDGLHPLPVGIQAKRMATNSNFLEINARNRTYFVNKIQELTTIL